MKSKAFLIPLFVIAAGLAAVGCGTGEPPVEAGSIKTTEEANNMGLKTENAQNASGGGTAGGPSDMETGA